MSNASFTVGPGIEGVLIADHLPEDIHVATEVLKQALNAENLNEITFAPFDNDWEEVEAATWQILDYLGAL